MDKLEDKMTETYETERKEFLSAAPPPSMKNPLQQIIVVSLSFMSVYTAYLAIQNLQSSLNFESGLGVTSLAFLYGSIILSGIFAPIIIHIIGEKWCLTLAWSCHTLYTISNFYPGWFTLIPTSVLLGLVAGPMWTSQGMYLTVCGKAYAYNKGQNLYTVLSKLNSIFFTFYEINDLFGNVVSSFILTRSSYKVEEFHNATKSCGAHSGPEISASAIMKPEKHIIYTLLGVFLVFDIIGLLFTALCLKPLPKNENNESRSWQKTCISFCSALRDFRLVLIIPLFMATAMSQGILFTEYTKSYISCALGVDNVGFIMASHGVVSAVTALLMGRVAKFTGRIVQFVIAATFNGGMLSMMLFWDPLNASYIVFFTIPVGLGISEGILRMQFNTFIAIVFHENIESAFANYHTWNAIAFTMTFCAGLFLPLSVLLSFVIGLMVLGLIGYLTTEMLIKYRQKIEVKEVLTVVESQEEN